MNDITAVELLKTHPSSAQWTRAKSFDGFGPFGPVISTVEVVIDGVGTFSNRYT